MVCLGREGDLVGKGGRGCQESVMAWILLLALHRAWGLVIMVWTFARSRGYCIVWFCGALGVRFIASVLAFGRVYGGSVLACELWV
jgi:hypothetical protein